MVLNEALGFLSMLSLLGLMIGACLVVLHTPSSVPGWAVGDGRSLLAAFGRPWALILLGATIVATLFLGPLVYAAPEPLPLGSPVSKRRPSITTAGLLDQQLRAALAFVALAALASGWCSALFRCVALMLLAVPEGAASPWLSWEAYVIVLAAAVLGVSQVHLLNRGLCLGDAMTVVPTFYALGMLAQLAAALLFFEELIGFHHEPLQNICLFVLGVVLTVSCVALLGRGEAAAGEEQFHLDDADAAADATESQPLLQTPSPHKPSRAQTPAAARRPTPLDPFALNVSPSKDRGYSMDALDFEESFPGAQRRRFTVAILTPGLS